MGPKTEELIVLLERASALLQEAGDSYHANQVVECLHLLARSDFRGIGCVLMAFHAKGRLSETAPPAVDELSHKICRLAEDIRREVDLDTRKDR